MVHENESLSEVNLLKGVKLIDSGYVCLAGLVVTGEWNLPDNCRGGVSVCLVDKRMERADEATLGWDTAGWDDNQPAGQPLWNESFVADVSYATEAEWIAANGTPAITDVWYNTTNDTLYQHNGTTWVQVNAHFQLYWLKQQERPFGIIPPYVNKHLLS